MAKHRLPQRRIAPLPVSERESLLSLLSHKGPIWLWQLQHCLSHNLSALTSEHYVVSTQEGLPAAHLSVCHAYGTGILGHVFVGQQHRGQGLSSQLLEMALQQHPDTRLYLGCEPGSLAESIYLKRGFQILSPGFLCRPKSVAPLPVSDGYQRLQFWHWPHLVALGASCHPAQCWEGQALEWLKSGQSQVRFEDGCLREHIQA